MTAKDKKPAKRQSHTLLKPHRHAGRDRDCGDKVELTDPQAARLKKAEII